MDAIKRPYRTLMRFGTDPNQVAEIQWQFAQPGALPLEFSTPFVCRDWIHWEIWPDVGEVQYAPRQNSPVDTTSPLAGTGQPCGSPAVWAAGYPGTVPAAYPRGVFGQLLCCRPPMGAAGIGTLPKEPNFPTPSSTSRLWDLLWGTGADDLAELLPRRLGAWWMARVGQWTPRPVQPATDRGEVETALPRRTAGWWPPSPPALWTPKAARPVEVEAVEVEATRAVAVPVLTPMPRWLATVRPEADAATVQREDLVWPQIAATTSGGGGGWPAQVYIQMPGTVDNHCDCQPFRDGVYLDLVDPDPNYPSWELVDPLGSGGGCLGTITFERTAVDQWSVSFSGPAIWVVTMGAWDGVATVTLTRTSGADQFQCTNYPATINVVPV